MFRPTSRVTFSYFRARTKHFVVTLSRQPEAPERAGSGPATALTDTRCTRVTRPGNPDKNHHENFTEDLFILFGTDDIA